MTNTEAWLAVAIVVSTVGWVWTVWLLAVWARAQDNAIAELRRVREEADRG